MRVRARRCTIGGMTDEARAHTAAQLLDQAHWCEIMGSPLYAGLLERAARDVEAAGLCWDVLAPHVEPGRGAALALRFMAAVHRLVLTGAAPRLAACYPTAGGTVPASAWEPFVATVAAHAETLRRDVAAPCQTNEVGRCAALVFGFLAVAQETALPLRLLEVGASAGLNLRWDHFRYGDGRTRWGDAASPVDLDGLWEEPPLHVAPPVVVTDRRGCDLHPLDVLRGDDRLRLESSIWADQPHRLHRLRGAAALAARVPAHLDTASLVEWLPARLAEPAEGAATVVYHSVVEEYVPPVQWAAFQRLLEDHGRGTSARAPLAWLRLEPHPGERRHRLTLRLWPGGQERPLATCGAHGTGVRRFVA
jgi:hypothetical protein